MSQDKFSNLSLICPVARPSSNYEELIYVKYMAVVETILVLCNTPINSLQDYTDFGFDLEDFIYRSEKSEEYLELVSEFQTKVHKYCNGEDVKCSVRREGSDVIVDIKYVSDGVTYNSSIVNSFNNGKQSSIINYDKIIVR